MKATKTLRLPTKVKVGPHVYTVQEKPEITHEGRSCWGLCDRHALTVDVISTQQPSHALDTVLHEFLHAVWNASGIPDEIDEELVVSRLAQGLAALFVDNPKLIEWIMGVSGYIREQHK